MLGGFELYPRWVPLKSLYLECCATMPMLADAHIFRAWATCGLTNKQWAIFHSHGNKTHFHKKGCAPSLILKVGFWNSEVAYYRAFHLQNRRF